MVKYLVEKGANVTGLVRDWVPKSKLIFIIFNDIGVNIYNNSSLLLKKKVGLPEGSPEEETKFLII